MSSRRSVESTADNGWGMASGLLSGFIQGVYGGKETGREGAGGITAETIQELDNDAWLRNGRGEKWDRISIMGG